MKQDIEPGWIRGTRKAGLRIISAGKLFHDCSVSGFEAPSRLGVRAGGGDLALQAEVLGYNPRVPCAAPDAVSDDVKPNVLLRSQSYRLADPKPSPGKGKSG